MTSWLLLFSKFAQAGSSFMPAVVNEIGRQVNGLYLFLLIVSGISCAILIGGMVYFALKYRRRTNNDKTAYITHNTFLEFLWSFIPLVIFLFVFGWGYVIFHTERSMPENALEVHAFGKQWSWEFVYKSGKSSTNEFYVPVNTNVKIILTSKDVLHSFYLPSMRLKQDAVPGRYTALWFTSEKLGDFNVFCAEFCGTAHSGMVAKLHVVSQEDYEKWLQENDEALTVAQRGEKLYTTKGCVACHSVDGSIKVGPSWKGLFGNHREWEGGSSGKADENYIHESIVEPNAKVVKGFPKGVMPSYQGQVSEVEISALIEYMKGLK
jgi:cytochrome c oxidase subunit 2